jgi:hypothetical protein
MSVGGEDVGNGVVIGKDTFLSLWPCPIGSVNRISRDFDVTDKVFGMWDIGNGTRTSNGWSRCGEGRVDKRVILVEPVAVGEDIFTDKEYGTTCTGNWDPPEDVNACR